MYHRQKGMRQVNTIKLNCENKPLMVAHRGVSGLEKENTHAAFIAAGNRSYYGIETDIHRTLDGRYVCIHDSNTKRVALDGIVVEECTFETLRRLRLCGIDGRKGREDICIPSFEEYIAICRKYEKTAVPELKGLFTREQVAEICEIAARGEWLDRTVFISFEIENLAFLRELYPCQPAQLLAGSGTECVCEKLNEYGLDLDISHLALTEELADRVHADGHRINVWTVNTLTDAERAVGMGVEFITSNILE